MADRITDEERRAIDSYTGPTRRIPMGISGNPVYIWTGWRLAEKHHIKQRTHQCVARFAITRARWTTYEYAKYAQIGYTTALYRISVAAAMGMISSNGEGKWEIINQCNCDV